VILPLRNVLFHASGDTLFVYVHHVPVRGFDVHVFIDWDSLVAHIALTLCALRAQVTVTHTVVCRYAVDKQA
jgi:hypothetical protein